MARLQIGNIKNKFLTFLKLNYKKLQENKKYILFSKFSIEYIYFKTIKKPKYTAIVFFDSK